MLFLLILITPLSALAERPQAPQAHVYRVGADLSYFNSIANYDSGGNPQPLMSGGSYTLTGGSLSGAYDWSQWLRTSADISFVQAHRTSDLYGEGSATGLNEISLLAQAWLPVGNFSFVPELAVNYPLWRLDESSEHPLLGEGATRFNGGGWLIVRTTPVQPFAYAAYVHRDSGRSGLLSYALGAHFQHKLFYAEGSWHGFSSITDDVDTATGTNRTVRELFLNEVNAGSFRHYAINPSLGLIRLEAGTQFGLWGFWGNIEFTTNGHNSADGWSARGGFIFSSEAPKNYSAPPPVKATFEMQDEKYDESLFQDKPKPKPSKKIRRKVRKKKSIEKLLHETEKQLSTDEE